MSEALGPKPEAVMSFRFSALASILGRRVEDVRRCQGLDMLGMKDLQLYCVGDGLPYGG